ncbi:MAG: choice-of-anchor B family protein [Leptolyngbya sp. PLA3]|nr:MAG: choice-of-anchor B family protein [Cyanobacteria bacterium CYA]MCE7968080.1 choice-of-anchor B family protein [Leptolyngbya sp. PL-A3]
MKRNITTGGLVVILGLCGPAQADEDGRKLLDLKPMVPGPIWRLGDGAPRGFNSSGVTLLSWLPLNNFPGGHGSGNDCWGHVSQSGREYAIIGLERGFGFVEVTDPANPVIVASIPGPTSLWHDVKVIGNYAYGVSEGGSGIQVMDMSDIDNGVVTLVRNQQTGGHSSTHNIVSNPDAGTLYLVGANIGNGGLVNLDMTDPTRPTVATGWTEMYVHDAMVVTYTEGPYAGREIAFCASGFNGGWNSTGLRIVDVTDKNNIFTISTYYYTTPAYSHQVWLSPDKHYAYLDDELDEQNGLVPTTTTRIIDVSNLSAPVQVGTFTSNSTSIDHNLYTRDQYIFEANYTSGLRVFDASNPVSPVQIAFFDTYPSDDNANFNGAWSCYPYFPSGTVVVSDMNRGLFVLRVDAIDGERLDIQLVGNPPSMLNPFGGTTLEATITEEGQVLNPTTVSMVVVDADGIEHTVVGAPTGSGTYRFNSPPLDCAEQVEYFISAQSTSGEYFFAPLTAPTRGWAAIAASGSSTPFEDDFQADLGWTTAGTASDGQWSRGVPVGGGDRGDPAEDFDGSGACYLTDNVDDNSDVDAGTVTLTSPAMDASGGRAFLNYARWFSNTSGAAPQEDVFTVQVSNDNGSSWTTLEVVGPAGPEVFGGWVYKSFDLTTVFASPSSQFKARFIAADEGSGSVVEAAVDAVSIVLYECEAPPTCPPDRNGDGALDFFDVQDFLADFAAHHPSADLTGDGMYDFFDAQMYLATFAAGCP